jgi:hypothetical protein
MKHALPKEYPKDAMMKKTAILGIASFFKTYWSCSA